MNHLYYGDNLAVLRDSIVDESVDLICLEPPSTRTPSGNESAAQIEALDGSERDPTVAPSPERQMLRRDPMAGGPTHRSSTVSFG